MKLKRREVLGLAVGGGASLLAPARLLAAPSHKGTFNIIPIDVPQVLALADGTLAAVVRIGRHLLQVPLGLSAEANPEDDTCPILNLELGAIHLDLLGLNVDTSDICLSVTADPDGGLVGALLCAVANLLNNGISLADILAGLTDAERFRLLRILAALLDQALAAATTNQAFAGVSGTTDGACDILNLALGPIDLTLLGLNVHLDDCDGGPVTVDITAEPGAGKLLGNLLCALANLLNPVAINALLRRIAREILRLVTA